MKSTNDKISEFMVKSIMPLELCIDVRFLYTRIITAQEEVKDKGPTLGVISTELDTPTFVMGTERKSFYLQFRNFEINRQSTGKIIAYARSSAVVNVTHLTDIPSFVDFLIKVNVCPPLPKGIQIAMAKNQPKLNHHGEPLKENTTFSGMEITRDNKKWSQTRDAWSYREHTIFADIRATQSPAVHEQKLMRSDIECYGRNKQQVGRGVWVGSVTHAEKLWSIFTVDKHNKGIILALTRKNLELLKATFTQLVCSYLAHSSYGKKYKWVTPKLSRPKIITYFVKLENPHCSVYLYNNGEILGSDQGIWSKQNRTHLKTSKDFSIFWGVTKVGEWAPRNISSGSVADQCSKLYDSFKLEDINYDYLSEYAKSKLKKAFCMMYRSFLDVNGGLEKWENPILNADFNLEFKDFIIGTWAHDSFHASLNNSLGNTYTNILKTQKNFNDFYDKSILRVHTMPVDPAEPGGDKTVCWIVASPYSPTYITGTFKAAKENPFGHLEYLPYVETRKEHPEVKNDSWIFLKEGERAPSKPLAGITYVKHVAPPKTEKHRCKGPVCSVCADKFRRGEK